VELLVPSSKARSARAAPPRRARGFVWVAVLLVAGACGAARAQADGFEPMTALQDAPRPLGSDPSWRPASLGAPPASQVLGLSAAAPVAYAVPRAVTAPGAARLRRGPIEVRDEWLLAQPKLTLPALSPDPVGRGRWQVRVAVNRGNDFGWTQAAKGELPEAGDRRFLVDGEHQTTEASVRVGVSSSLDLAVRLPVHWRGGGFMDGMIDLFHETFAFMGILDNDRDAFRVDKFRVEGRSDDYDPFSWTADEGMGLGNVELAAHWAFAGTQPGARWTWAAVGRVTLPTSTSVFETDGVDVGVQLLAAHRLAPAWDLYMGLGGTWFSEPEVDGVRYEEIRASGFLVVEWRPAPTWSLLVELNASSNLVTNISLYPELQTYVNIGAKLDLSRCWQLELGFTENIVDQQSTTDFGAFAGLVGRF
jgi:hypothetical protein